MSSLIPDVAHSSLCLVSVERTALHTQQSYCFGNSPRERGAVITWFTPTLFSPLSIGSHWMGSRGKKNSTAIPLIAYQTLDHSGWQIWTGNFLLPVCLCPDNIRFRHVLGNLSQWKPAPKLTFHFCTNLTT